LVELIRILKALSDETRYNIIKLLLSHDYCVGALAKRLNISESAVSQHLKVLRKAGIVKGDKRGYYTHYWVDREFLKEVANKIIELSCLPPEDNGCNKHTSKDLSFCRKEESKMCKNNCKHPELKPKDGKCSEKQVKECHGDEMNHPCDCEDK